MKLKKNVQLHMTKVAERNSLNPQVYREEEKWRGTISSFTR
jgi:hypothetical protein